MVDGIGNGPKTPPTVQDRFAHVSKKAMKDAAIGAILGGSQSNKSNEVNDAPIKGLSIEHQGSVGYGGSVNYGGQVGYEGAVDYSGSVGYGGSVNYGGQVAYKGSVE